MKKKPLAPNWEISDDAFGMNLERNMSVLFLQKKQTNKIHITSRPTS